MQPNSEPASDSIDLDTPVASKPTRTLTWALVVALCIAALAVMVAALAVGKMPQPADATPVATRTVTLTARGTAMYFDVSGPGIDLGGSKLPGVLVVPVGTRVHLVALIDAVDAESACAIRVGDSLLAAENGYGLAAVSDCDVVVK